jgi:hypothetical protein
VVQRGGACDFPHHFGAKRNAGNFLNVDEVNEFPWDATIVLLWTKSIKPTAPGAKVLGLIGVVLVVVLI